jgi:hypothetical protein
MRRLCVLHSERHPQLVSCHTRESALVSDVPGNLYKPASGLVECVIVALVDVRSVGSQSSGRTSPSRYNALSHCHSRSGWLENCIPLDARHLGVARLQGKTEEHEIDHVEFRQNLLEKVSTMHRMLNRLSALISMPNLLEQVQGGAVPYASAIRVVAEVGGLGRKIQALSEACQRFCLP